MHDYVEGTVRFSNRIINLLPENQELRILGKSGHEYDFPNHDSPILPLPFQIPDKKKCDPVVRCLFN